LALNNSGSGCEVVSCVQRSGAFMSFKFDRVHLWFCEVADQAGGVASKLAFLAQAGANLEYVYTKRLVDKPGAGVLYVAPVTGATQVRAARSAGLAETDEPVVRRIEGDNEAGLAHRLTQQWAIAGISFGSLTMAVLNNKFVGYASFDTVADANRAAQILADLGAAC
jgi:hypothetical protein